LSQPLVLERLVVAHLRNLREVTLEPAARLNVVSGDNGQGKTSLLEAIYLAATSRSFRTAVLGELVQHGADTGSTRAAFREATAGVPLLREQSVGLSGGRRTVRLDGAAPTSLTYFATRSPVVVFDAKQLALSSGPASERRTLLDRVVLFVDPEMAIHRARYRRALRERQRVLADRGGNRAAELDAYEQLLAVHGASLTRARRRASELLAVETQAAFARIATPGLEVSVTYEPAGCDDAAAAAEHLAAARADDARRRRAGFGPHADDLALALDGHPARAVASQGQHRALTLALKSAELACVGAARGLQPILLLDDVSSELDAERTDALLDFLATTSSQLFLTTTRPALIARNLGSDRRDFTMRGGEIETASGAR
jgi:DNA replication and repair protein RecF